MKVRRLAAWLSVAALSFHGVGALAQEGKPEAMRPALAQIVTATQALLKEGQPKAALARLVETEGVSDLSAYEAFFIERVRVSAAASAVDLAQTSLAVERLLASGRLAAGEAPVLLAAAAKTAYRAKDWTAVVAWARRYDEAKGGDPSIRQLASNALYAKDDFAGAVQSLVRELQGTSTPAEDRLKLLASAQLRAKDEADYVATLERLVSAYPKKTYWADLVYRTQQRSTFDSKQLALDAFRLQRSTSGLADAGDAMEMAQLAMDAGYAMEAKAVLDEARELGLLGSGAGVARQQALVAKVVAAAAEDKAELDRPLPATASSAVRFRRGLNLVFAGRVDAGVTLMEQAVAATDPAGEPVFRLRLGVGLLVAGQRAKAIETLKRVQAGNGVGDLTRLWLLHLQSPQPS